MSTSMKPTDDGELIATRQKPQTQEDPDQSFGRSKEWEDGVAEALDDLKEGRYKEFDNVEDLIADLKG